MVKAGSDLADEAGSAMSEIVASIKRVTDIMSEISVSSQSQSDGIAQVNSAVALMDGVTQQNAALVEEAAAAAQSLQEQAARLSHGISIFNVGEEGDSNGVLSTAMQSQSPLFSVQQRQPSLEL